MKKLGLLCFVILLVGCTSPGTNNPNTEININTPVSGINSVEDNNLISELEEPVEEPVEEPTEEPKEEPLEEPVEEVEEPIDYLGNQVNEAGQIMVVMYHNLADEPGSYATTPDLLRRDLNRLYEEGYRTISMTDFVTGNISVPLGTTPVVLTFDDATLSNFYYEDGEIAKDSVVGILEAFYAEYPDFGRNAIFYTYSTNPFRERDLIQEKLDYLVENGYEIGNHSYGHKKLNTLDAQGIQKELALNEALIESYIEGYDMKHLCLPYGIRPAEALQQYLFEGSYEETTYNMISAVNVGWNPVKSPYHIDFNPKSINRITCGDDDFELMYWMDDFKANRHKKYISDGDSDTIVVPTSVVDQLIETEKTIITYEQED